MSFMIFSKEENAFVGYKNKKFKNSKSWHLSKGVNPWFLSKNGRFFDLFFLGNIGQENVFYDIIEGENNFLGSKKQELQNVQKIDIYPKGLTQNFGP